MAAIDQIADGESGLSVRNKLNQIHDQIVEITGDYTQLQADDVIIADAATLTLIDLLSITLTPANGGPLKALTVFNADTSANNVVLQPFGAETIDGDTTLTLLPGESVTITPTAAEWITQNIGIVDSVNGSTNITISGPAEDPIVSLNSSISGMTVNGVTLNDNAGLGTFLEGDGAYVTAVTAVTGGTGISNSGTPNVPVMDLDSSINATVNGVDLEANGDNFSYLDEDGQYTVPTGNIVEVSTNYTQVVRDDIIIVDQAFLISVDLVPIATAVKAIIITNEGTATLNIEPDGAETVEGISPFPLGPGKTITLTPNSTTNWIELAATAGVEGVTAGTNMSVDNSDPANPVINLPANITGQQVNGVTLSTAAGAGSVLAGDGTYIPLPSAGAQLALLTLQAFTEQDIIDELGSGPVWNLSGYNLQVMAKITLTTGNSFLIDTAGATVEGVDRNISELIGNSTLPMFDFTADTDTTTDLTFQPSNLNMSQLGTGDMVREDGIRFIFKDDNCGLTGNTNGGHLRGLRGQFFGINDGVLQGGARIIQGDGTSAKPGVEFMIFGKSFLQISDLFADNQRMIEFMPNCIIPRFSTDTFSQLINPDFGFGQRTGGVGIYIHKSADIRILNYMGGGFSPMHATSRAIVMEDPASVKFMLIGGNTQEGAGELYQFIPPPAVSTISLTNVRGLGFDGTNLLAVDSPNADLLKYVGTTSTVGTTIDSPGGNPTDLTWYKGNLVSLDFGGSGTVYLHDGFTISITTSVALSSLGLGIGGVRGITTDGTNIIITSNFTDIFVFGPNFFSDPTNSFVKSFTVPGLGSLHALAYDGVNLLVADNTADTISVLKGITPIIQYAFDPVGTSPIGITITDVGFALADIDTDDIQIFDVFPTVDHSARTFEVMGNVGDQEQIKVDPINDALWTTSNSGTVSDAGGILTLTNGAASVGTADFPLECVPGHTYTVTNGYTPGTSATAGFAILDESLATIVSDTVSVAGDVVLTFVAPDQAMTFRFTNPPAVSGETSILTSLTQIDDSYKIIESSDKGGAVFSAPSPIAISPALVQDVLSDITGTDLFYGPFSKREKSRLKDELTGTIEITSVRDRGQTFQGSIVIDSTANGDLLYELLVVINDEPQEDSVGAAVTTSMGDVRTITTQAITRDITDTGEAKLQLRPVGHGNNVNVYRYALSHAE